MNTFRMELLALANRQFTPKIVVASVDFFRIFFMFLVSERIGLRKA